MYLQTPYFVPLIWIYNFIKNSRKNKKWKWNKKGRKTRKFSKNKIYKKRQNIMK